MQVRDGQVALVSDASGHYQPGSKQMMQTVQELERKKVAMERLGVEFVGKREDKEDEEDEEDENGYLQLDEEDNPLKQDQPNKNMQVSALELLGYANHSPHTAEAQMRKSHAKKNEFYNSYLVRQQLETAHKLLLDWRKIHDKSS
ncbi:hypothetical protein [Cohnella herbarum]|uniref:Uncharacterized protein n=1 Tax=Cohnella herbarum TaxID=2728023 RepID=A0A7Z2VQ10_9BACL|nr:hypothetical protein [Cohnella herbarum]QJD87073.1 hypothetical protein HH215_30455 [Cohnella herbarum]